MTPSEQRYMPEGAMEAFPEISLSGVTVSQAAGPVDMIIGRDNPEWMPVHSDVDELEPTLHPQGQ